MDLTSPTIILDILSYQKNGLEEEMKFYLRNLDILRLMSTITRKAKIK